MSVRENIEKLRASLPADVTLVAVSKTYPPEAIMEAYDAGQRIFGENRPQELKAKHEVLPADIRWHLIGQLQTNKVKYVAPFVELIHSVDSDKLLSVIDKEAGKNGRTIDILLEVHIAREQTKSGWNASGLSDYMATGQWRGYGNVRIRGLMSIASNTTDTALIRREFEELKALFDELRGIYFSSPGDMTERTSENNNSSHAYMRDSKDNNPSHPSSHSVSPLASHASPPTSNSYSSAPRFDILSAGMTSDYREAIECGSNMVRIGSLIFGKR